MENIISKTSSKRPGVSVSAERTDADAERAADAVALVLRLRQLGDCGLRRAMQRLTDNK